MQLLKITDRTTLSELSDAVGDRNVQSILAANNLQRVPNIGKAFKSVCNQVVAESSDVDTKRKIALLDTLTNESDIFESVAVQGESGWKITSALGTLPNMLKIPDSITIPDSVNVLGNHQAIGNRIYKQAITSLKQSGTVDPGIFNEYRGVRDSQLVSMSPTISTDPFQWFNLPWGQITLYSSIDKESKDFPVYPEELSDSYKANYTQMPDMLYQYEPWQVYQSSGPRSNSYTFTFHRDMWTGDHTDGKANELIRFCEANCYPEYKGSAVNPPTVTLYIAGQPHITGVLTEAAPKWSGPIGSDGWYLVCELTLTITEVSKDALDYYTVKKKGIVG